MALEMDKPLVSIIVPVYNVGAYVKPCVRSLLAQTYENIEVLVINDGSTDDSVEMVKAVVADDPRLKILNKENGGLSSARNYGTERCAGDYIMYVDGDDLIDARAVELMVGAAEAYGVSLVAASHAKVSPLSAYEAPGQITFEVEDGCNRLKKLLLLNGESGSAWGKLYARSLVPMLEYPEGQLFEDLEVTAKVYSQIDKVAFTAAPLYAYVTRPNSITTLKKQGSKHAADMDRAIAKVHEAIGEGFESEFECFRAYCTLRVAMRIDLNNYTDREAGQKYLRRARQLSRLASKNPLASRTWRLRCALFACSPAAHNVLYSLYGRLSGKAIG